MDLTSREAYDYYRAKRKRVCGDIKEYREFVLAVNGLFMELTKMIYSNDGGVYIEGLGYFCYLVKPKKVKERGKRQIDKSLMNRFQKVHRYYPYFFPDKDFKDYTMSGAFTNAFTRFKDLDNPYKLHFNLCKAYKEALKLQDILTYYK